MIAQAEFCPAHLGAIIYVVEWTILEIGKENFQPGDVVFHNDPFRGGCHLPEYCVIKPVFYDDELVAFTACIGHMTEVGGKVPGGFAGDATEVFQEGLRIPPLKIVEGGKDVEAVWNIIMANVRTPRISYGDMRPMIGSLYVGERRMHELVEKHGVARFGSDQRGDQGLLRAAHARRDRGDAGRRLRVRGHRHRQRRRDLTSRPACRSQ